MIARVTTTVAVLRGSTTNSFGDPVDGTTEVLTGIPASMIERSRRTYLPAEGATRVVRSTTCRLTHGTAVLKTDRIKDEQSEAIYNILDMNDDPGSPVHLPDVVLELSRTS